MLVAGILVSVPSLGAEPFDIGFDERIGFTPFFVAAEKGFYHGLEVRFSRVTKEDELRDGLASGRSRWAGIPLIFPESSFSLWMSHEERTVCWRQMA